MRKKPAKEEFETRARRREIKKRPRMKMHGASLRKARGHEAGLIQKFKRV